MKTEYDQYFEGNQFFNYNEKTRRVEHFLQNAPQCDNNGHFCYLTAKFGSRMAQILGFDYYVKYNLYSSYATNDSPFIPAPFPSRMNGGIDFALFYADCVSPTIYGCQHVILLEVISMESAGGKDFHQTAYKSLSKTIIDSIAIQLADQVDRAIHFGRGKSITLLLHIRQK